MKHSSCVNVVIRARLHSAVKFQQIYILFLTGPVPTGECANFKSFVKYSKMHKLWLTLDTSLRLRFRFRKCRDLSDLQLIDRGHCLLGVIQSSSSELVKCNVCYVKLLEGRAWAPVLALLTQHTTRGPV